MSHGSRRALAVAVAVAALSCQYGPAPTASGERYTIAPASGRATGRWSDPGSVLVETRPRLAALSAADNLAPEAVFKVKPAPGEDGWISGSGSPGDPFLVELNACATSDPESDRLFFTIDIESDGTPEEVGTTGGNCRLIYPFTAKQGEVRELEPSVCVVDIDAAGNPLHGAQCRAYKIRVFGPPLSPDPPSGGGACTIGIGAGGWFADSDFVTCTCAADGTVIDNSAYSAACVSAGGFPSIACSCFATPP